MWNQEKRGGGARRIVETHTRQSHYIVYPDITGAPRRVYPPEPDTKKNGELVEGRVLRRTRVTLTILYT